MYSSTHTTTTGSLRARFGESLITPDDERFAASAQVFNLLVEQRPEAVALPASAAEAAAMVAAIRDAGLRIAPQGSGHNAAPLGSLEGTVVMKLDRLKGVRIDAETQTARVEAGARWWDVTPAAAEAGLSALHGSSPEINVVGYSLGGGIGWQGRKRGMQANSLTAIEIVTADGELRRVDAETDADLFWALRGGGGNFGVVVAIEFRLYPVAKVYAGSLFFPYERSAEILHAWREWTEVVPEEITSAVRMLQLPELEEIPEFIRGKSFAVVGAAFLGDAEEGFELTRPLRALVSEIDTFDMVPVEALSYLHMDPVDPMPYETAHAMLGELPEKAIDDLIGAVGPGTGSILPAVELRHLGGALSRAPEGAGAIATMPGEYLSFAVGAVMAPEMAPAVEAQLGAMNGALAPFDSGRYLNFTEEPDDLEKMFPSGTLPRLREVKRAVDPDGLFKANHPV